MIKRKKLTLAAVSKILTDVGMIRLSPKMVGTASGFTLSNADNDSTIIVQFNLCKLSSGFASYAEARDYAQLALDDAGISYLPLVDYRIGIYA